MGTHEDAQELLSKMAACRSRSFFKKIDEIQQGVGFVLVCLAEADDTVVAGDLAKELNVSTARIAAILKKMEDSGLAIRKRSNSDARQTEVEITQKGLIYVNKLKEQLISRTELVIEKIGKEKLEEYIRISARINEILDENE